MIPLAEMSCLYSDEYLYRIFIPLAEMKLYILQSISGHFSKPGSQVFLIIPNYITKFGIL